MLRSVGNRSFATSAIVAATLLVSGCGQNTVTSPDSGSFGGQAILLPAGERPTHSAFLGGNMPSVTRMVSASDGGMVRLGRYTLEFPAGALSNDTEITIRQNDPAAMVIELEPHGIQFNRPVTLTGNVAGLVSSGAKSVGVAWMNDGTGQWEAISRDSGSASSTSAELWHFSEYEFWLD